MSSEEIFVTVVVFTFLLAFILTWILSIAVGFTLARRLKKEFEHIYEFYVPLSPWLLWVWGVIVCCVIKGHSSNKRMYPFFKGYDVRGFATKWEKMMCFGATISSFGMAFILVFAYFCDLIFGTQIIGAS